MTSHLRRSRLTKLLQLTRMSFSIDSIDHIVLNVKDAEEAAAWYTRVLGLARLDFPSPTGLRIALQFGNQKINLRPIDSDPVEWFTGTAVAPGSADLCFVTKSNPETVRDYWISQRVRIVAGPVERQGALGSMISVYCRDPDGNLIEVASYR
jgi:catechol 2,3-dioxygenase-like lactoylglutathione lyase family enzyme